MQSDSRMAVGVIIGIVATVLAGSVIPILSGALALIAWLLQPLARALHWSIDDTLMVFFMLIVPVLIFLAGYTWTAVQRRDPFWMNRASATERCAFCGRSVAVRYSSEHAHYVHGLLKPSPTVATAARSARG